MTCNQNCNQGRACPARTAAAISFAAECEGVMPMSTGCSVKALPTPKRQPLPVADMQPLDPLESALVWLVVSVCAALCLYSIVRFLQFIGG